MDLSWAWPIYFASSSISRAGAVPAICEQHTLNYMRVSNKETRADPCAIAAVPKYQLMRGLGMSVVSHPASSASLATNWCWRQTAGCSHMTQRHITGLSVAYSLSIRNKAFKRAPNANRQRSLTIKIWRSQSFQESACMAWTQTLTDLVITSALRHRNKWSKFGKLFKQSWALTAL